MKKVREKPHPIFVVIGIMIILFGINYLQDLYFKLPKEYEKPCIFLCIDRNMTFAGGNNYMRGGKGCIVCHCKDGDYTLLTVPIDCVD